MLDSHVDVSVTIKQVCNKQMQGTWWERREDKMRREIKNKLYANST